MLVSICCESSYVEKCMKARILGLHKNKSFQNKYFLKGAAQLTAVADIFSKILSKFFKQIKEPFLPVHGISGFHLDALMRNLHGKKSLNVLPPCPHRTTLLKKAPANSFTIGLRMSSWYLMAVRARIEVCAALQENA